MHKHTIDWLRQVNITADAALGAKRWNAAKALSERLTRSRVIEMLRMFIFPIGDPELARKFTDELIALDPEFPVSQNAQELRLMAGLVMVTTLSANSHKSRAFGLGLRAANFPAQRVQPVEPSIVAESEIFLQSAAGRVRPNEFTDGLNELVTGLREQEKALAKAEEEADEAEVKSAFVLYRKAIHDTIVASGRKLGSQVEQLAEESSLLWWVLAEYSDVLQRPVRELKPEAYAFVSAVEASRRTVILPPPPSIGPLLARALKPCKATKKALTLSAYLEASDPSWRGPWIKSLSISDCRDLLPFSASLEKFDELNDVSATFRVLPKICPGVSGDLPITPTEAAVQMFAEIAFTRALSELTNA